MNFIELQERLDKMRKSAGDPEADHGAEDDLRRDVLTAIAQDRKLTKGHMRVLAAMALSTDEFINERWYA